MSKKKLVLKYKNLFTNCATFDVWKNSLLIGSIHILCFKTAENQIHISPKQLPRSYITACPSLQRTFSPRKKKAFVKCIGPPPPRRRKETLHF